MTETGTIDRDSLHRYVGRVLTLHEERKELNASISAVYEEAKHAGFVTGIIRQIVREKQMEADERLAHYSLLDTYRHALGMLADTPLGAAAMATARVEEEAYPGSLAVERPRPFAEQTVHKPRSRPRKTDAANTMMAGTAKPRARPRKAKRDDEDALARAEPVGAA